MVDNLTELPREIKQEKRSFFKLAKRPLRSALSALLFLQTLALPVAILANNQESQITNEHLVDVIIHHSLPPEQTEQWARDIINNYINEKFRDAEIRHRLSVHKVITNYNEQQECPDGGMKIPNSDVCSYPNSSRIRAWLFAQGQSGRIAVGTANPEESQVYIALPLLLDPSDQYASVRTKRALAHEVGHLFKMPDYYSEIVPSVYNRVVSTGISPFAQDIMTAVQHDHFSSVSKGFANRTSELPSGYSKPSWRIQYSPQNTIIKIIDDTEQPMDDVFIEVFPQKWEYPTGSRAHQIIPSVATFNGSSNNQGEFGLGNYFKIFDNPTGICACDSAFLRLTYGDSVKYAAITASYLNHLYFQGNEETAIVTVPFSSLHTFEQNQRLTLSAPGVTSEPY